MKFCTYLAALSAVLLVLSGGAARGANASAYELVEQGNAAYQAGRYEAALKHYAEASVVNPELAELYFNQGTVHYQQGDYEAATKAFSEAALRGREPALEARARYNQGNCAFREAERQRDSDLKKAIEACTEAIGHYQDARRLDPTMTEAAENIEIVRLYVKALLDEQRKKEEEQQKKDDLGKKLKELLDRQVAAVKENSTIATAQPAPPVVVAPTAPTPEPAPATDPLANAEPDLGNSAIAEPGESELFGSPEPEDATTDTATTATEEAWRKSIDDHASTQGTLQTDTGAVMEQMRQMEIQMRQQAAQGGTQPGQSSPSPAQPSPAQPNPMAEKLTTAIGHVGESVNAQGAAVRELSKIGKSSVKDLRASGGAMLASAQRRQQQSALELAEALKALSDPNEDQQEQKQGDDKKQDGDQQEQKDQKEQQEQQEQDGENKDAQDKDENGEEQQDEQQQKQDQGEQSEDDKGEKGEKGEQGDEGKDGEEQPQSALKPAGNSAEDILNEEKENQKKRVPVRVGGVRPVDKDW